MKSRLDWLSAVTIFLNFICNARASNGYIVSWKTKITPLIWMDMLFAKWNFKFLGFKYSSNIWNLEHFLLINFWYTGNSSFVYPILYLIFFSTSALQSILFRLSCLFFSSSILLLYLIIVVKIFRSRACFDAQSYPIYSLFTHRKVFCCA